MKITRFIYEPENYNYKRGITTIEVEFSNGLNNTWLLFKNNYTGVCYIEYDSTIIDLVFKKYVL